VGNALKVRGSQPVIDSSKALRLKKQAESLRANLLRRRLQQKEMQKAQNDFGESGNDDTQHTNKREA
jgi:hypothetical protein